ncbi:type IIL restriction-modification enzyme MmeI [Arthrobacter sp. H14]|uniref:type IIL restriction-modification enzyme MmeI n=1 Tax=Arthrobacter sp. H14 TaxID=1312959 RepID=UPI00047CEBBC|nr:type IIL restriction-modification enzyme MmeI [Arthrobacter sp. H14]
MHIKPLAWNEIRKNAASFVNEWAGETYEKGESQSFWSDLFAVYGVRRRNVAKFEQQARRITGGAGFIDVFWPGMMIAEQKSTGKSLGAAEAQAIFTGMNGYSWGGSYYLRCSAKRNGRHGDAWRGRG